MTESSANRYVARATFTLALALTAVAIGLALARAPLSIIGANAVLAQQTVEYARGDTSSCQGVGTVPDGTTAIRVSLGASVGPRVAVEVLQGGRSVAHGARPAGWGVGETVTVPVTAIHDRIPDASVCVIVGLSVEPLRRHGVRGQLSSLGGRMSAGVRLRMEYLRPGRRSWWSLAASVARNMGMGRAPAGTWIAYAALILMLAVGGLASRGVWRSAADPKARDHGVRRRAGRRLPRPVRRALEGVPRLALMCALIASLNAMCWSLVTPPFQAPDEPSHFAYAQLIAEAGRLPSAGESVYSPEETAVLEGLQHLQVRFHPEVHTISSAAAEHRLEGDLDRGLSRHGPTTTGVSSSQPPLYYLIETLPYALGSPGSLLDQLTLMRLLSALMAGITALFAVLFVREALPSSRWAWTIAGLSTALAAPLGFMSGAVNPDAMLFAVSAAVCYCLARGFRRGLTRRLAVAIGALTAIGFLTKLNFAGLAPGVVLGLVALTARAERAGRRAALGSFGIAIAIAVSPVLAYVLANALSHHPGLGAVVSQSVALRSRPGSLAGRLTYIWEFYLPHLPGMTNYFPGLSTVRQLWFDRAVGLYGWLDTPFPVWVYDAALVPASAIALLCLRALIAGGGSLRRRLDEIAVYVTMSVGLLVLVGAFAYANRATEGGAGYAQVRYLLPLLPLGSAALALAVRGAGRRLGAAVGPLIVVLFLAHDVFSLLQVVARYYG